MPPFSGCVAPASGFDQRLRSGLDAGEIEQPRALLAQLLPNVTTDEESTDERPAEGVAAS
jgi:hypothetical protein